MECVDQKESSLEKNRVSTVVIVRSQKTYKVVEVIGTIARACNVGIVDVIIV